MGADQKKHDILPLPAPTETESASLTPTELATDVSRPGDDKSSYSLPEDGTPVTIKTRAHRSNKSQTSLLIEYFEGGRGGGSSGSGSNEQRKPSVRVRVTPSSKSRGKSADRDHIQITETKSSRKVSRRSTPASPGTVREGESLSTISAGDLDDTKSMESYASQTEESNVSRNPIDIEINGSSGRVRSRRRPGPASPLIPAVDSKASYNPGAMSDISAIPTDSFLDGSGPTSTSFRMSDTRRDRSPSPSRARDVLGGAAAGLAAAAVVDKMRSKSKSREKERAVLPKTRDKERSSKHKSKSRSSSISEDKYTDGVKSPSRRRSSGRHQEAMSAVDSSILSSAMSPSHRSVDQHSIRSGTSKASSINNPKLLETVEDAIRRLILPELNALKREQSKGKSDRRGSATSSTTSLSRDEYATDRRRSAGTDRAMETPRDSLRVKERRNREARHEWDESPDPSGVSHEYAEEESEVHHDMDTTPRRGGADMLTAAAAGAAVGGLATAAMSRHAESEDKRQRERRRRRAEYQSRSSDMVAEDFESESLPPEPPMPLMSEINPSEVTRTSILSADTDRPHSASEEFAEIREVPRGELLSASSSGTTPTRTPVATLQTGLGTQHANISHGDLKALPRSAADEVTEEYETDAYGRQLPMPIQSQSAEIEEEEYDELAEPGQYAPVAYPYDYYNTQDVPPPLKYVPYQPERRGLSPIPSVSGYTEGGSEAANRDSRVTQNTYSPEKSPRRERGMDSPSSVPSNMRSRDFDEDERSTSNVDYRSPTFAEDSELSQTGGPQAVRIVGGNPNLIHADTIESNVASLVDGSMLDESVLVGESGHDGHEASLHHVDDYTEEEELSRSYASPSKRSLASQRGLGEDERATTSGSTSQRSQFADEYELNEYGQKVPRASSSYRQSPTASEQAITSRALAMAAANAAQGKGKQATVETEHHEEQFVPQGAGVQRNRSFKERTMNGQRPEFSRDVDHVYDNYNEPKLGHSYIPNMDEPMPAIGIYDDDLITNPSVVDGKIGGEDHGVNEHWAGEVTPRQLTPRPQTAEYEQNETAQEIAPPSSHGDKHAAGLAAAVVGGAALATAAALAHNHSRQPSQEHEDEWHRTSDDRKRDTLVTNPYEGASPIVNLPGLHDNFLGGEDEFGNGAYGDGFGTHSPLGHKVDEGYISQGPNKTPDMQLGKAKGVEFDPQSKMDGLEDPFVGPGAHQRHLSGLSQGMASPLYDAATGTGIDRIESKDIIALMQHLMVRDAQRSARDTEILVTLVRAATEMRNSFEDIKRMLVDTEDVIITEVKENTDKSIQRAINGPRPYPGSGARSLQGGGSQAGTDELATKKRSIFRRALKGLSAKGTNDLGRIEDMLMQLLSEVDVLKAQTAPGGATTSPTEHTSGQSYENLQQDAPYEQERDRGYEPEGNAGTSTASHASQSGHLSIPQSRGPGSGKLGYERKISGHRISTVPEGDEDEFVRQNAGSNTYPSNPDMLMTPTNEQRGTSVPLATPPQPAPPVQMSLSNENTPRTDRGKKHKSSSSSSWFPKISRWSEDTTSSIAKAFRSSGRKQDDEDHYHSAPPSRSGSNLGQYEEYQDPRTDPYGEDKLHSGFSEPDLPHAAHPPANAHSPAAHQPPPAAMDFISMTPEDPKYKVHRDSLNLQHPQPRPGQTELIKAAFESQMHNFDSPMSPKSADWDGSATSLHRLGQQGGYNPNRDSRDSYNSAADQQRFWTSSPAGATIPATSGPPRPPKEPLDNAGSSPLGARGAMATPPKSNRISKLQKGSPLPYHSVESGYGTMPHASYISHGQRSLGPEASGSQNGGNSPRLENRNLSGALGVPTRRPSGPRAMTPKSSGSVESADQGHLHGSGDERRRKRDTFGTIASQESETF